MNSPTLHVCHIPISLPRRDSPISGSYFVNLARGLNSSNQIKSGVFFIYPITLKRTQSGPRLTGLPLPRGIDACEVRTTGVTLDPRARSTRSSARWRETMVRGFQKYVSAHGLPDLLQAHSGRGAGEVALAVSKQYDIPFVVMEHNPAYLSGALSPVERARLSEVYAKASAIVYISPGMRQTIEEIAGGIDSNMHLIPNMIDNAFFRFTPEASAMQPSKDQLDMLTVGRLDDNKRNHLAIETLAKLKRDGISARLRIVGTGDKLAELRGLVERLHVQESVTFVGYLPARGVVHEMDQASVILQLSRRETFGLPVIESLARGRPVVATDSGGPSWIARRAPQGAVSIVDPSVPRIAASAMVANSITPNRKFQDALKAFAKDFSPEQVTDKWISLYSSIL